MQFLREMRFRITARYFIGYGKTEQEAELNLIGVLQAELDERKEKIREQSINNYYTDPSDKIS